MESVSRIHPRPHSGCGPPSTEQTAADNRAPSPQQFPFGSLMLCIDAQGKVRVCSAATTPCAPDHERQPKDGDLLLKVNGTCVGIAEDPRAVLESILIHALGSSGQSSAKLTFARPSPSNSGSSWLTFSFELPVQPHTYDKFPFAALRLHVPSSSFSGVPRKKIRLFSLCVWVLSGDACAAPHGKASRLHVSSCKISSSKWTRTRVDSSRQSRQVALARDGRRYERDDRVEWD
jgi:hypothetical protein